VVAAAVAAGLPPGVELVVLEFALPNVDELPKVDEPFNVDELLAGGPPIAVAPVGGDRFVVLPGDVGPASALDVELVEGPTPVVPGVAVVLDAMLLLPSVEEAVVPLPHGAARGTPVVWAIAATEQAASAAIANRLIRSLREMQSRIGRACAAHVRLNQCADALTRMPRICPASFETGGRG
jgi:hypothetical protein